MPATVPTRGVLKASTNRVRTSTALQGNAMWENVIGISNEQAGTNQGVEALINAPTIGGGRKAAQARRQAAAEAVMATGGFDTSVTNYASLLAIAKQQGAVGTATRGACKICGQTGHLTKQCRNALPGGGEGGGAEAAALLEAPPADDGADSLDLSSDSSDEERRRKRRKKEKKRKEKERKRRKEKKRSKDKKRKSSSKDKKRKRRRSSSSDSGSSSSSGSDSD